MNEYRRTTFSCSCMPEASLLTTGWCCTTDSTAKSAVRAGRERQLSMKIRPLYFPHAAYWIINRKSVLSSKKQRIHKRKLPHKSGGGFTWRAWIWVWERVAAESCRGRAPGWVVRDFAPPPAPKLRAFCLSELQTKRILCHPINCSFLLFERILLHFCLESFY